MDIQNITDEEKRRISIAYLLSGNSAIDLAEQLISTLRGSEGPRVYEEFYNDIVQDMMDSRKQAPETFETPVETELQILLETYNDHEYEANSQVWS